MVGYAIRCGLARFLPPKPHILLACMPKSASSFLARAIAELPGMSQRGISESHRRREQELDRIRLIKNHHRSYVAQQHIRYSEETDGLMREYNIVPIVLTRDLTDVVASFRDGMRSESFVCPFAWFQAEHVRLPDSELEEMIADHVMPWYVQFAESWKNCGYALHVHYDEVRRNPAQVLRKIATAGSIRASESEIQTAVNRARQISPRFNKGVSGRGREISPKAREHIRRLLSRYDDTAAAGLRSHNI